MKRKLKESRRVTSIASRINRHHVASLFWTLAVVGAGILAVGLMGWGYTVGTAPLRGGGGRPRGTP